MAPLKKRGGKRVRTNSELQIANSLDVNRRRKLKNTECLGAKYRGGDTTRIRRRRRE